MRVGVTRETAAGERRVALVPDSVGRLAQTGIGVVGMRERLRLLGGKLELESAPGGPTVVRAVLPRWTATP